MRSSIGAWGFCKRHGAVGAVVSMLATSSPALGSGSIPGGDRVFRALTDHTVPSDQDLK